MAFTPSKNEKRQNSACNCGTILAFSENQRQSTFHSRRKAPFLSPKTARTAGRCDRRGARTTPRLCPASPLAASLSAESRPQVSSFFVCRFRNAPARRRNVRFSGTWRVRARLCPESRTNRRHGRDGAKRGSRPQRGGSLVAASFSLHRPTTPLPPAAFSRSSPQGSALLPFLAADQW